MSPKLAEQMRWHDRYRVKDGKLRHPADVLHGRNLMAHILILLLIPAMLDLPLLVMA